MAETLLIDSAKGILSKVLSFVANEASLAWGFKGELKRLAKRLKMIQYLLSDADDVSAMETWLKSLNAVAYDADTIAHKIKAINLSLDDIFKEANKIGLKPVELINSSAGAGRREVLVTHPGIGDSEKIVGRDADVSMVADMLLMPNNENGLPVISIVGMPGQDKTTIAKLICKNDKVVSESDDFEDKWILNEMLSNMGGILKELRKHLNRKKYLVVLDDVWNEIPGKWESLRDALLETGGSSESKVLVTTRSSTVASTMTSFAYPLKHLSDDDSWIMFKQKAFANGGAVETSDFVEIGREIMKKCRGMPLAIKVVGGLMYSKKSRHEWLSVQDSHLSELPENVNRVIRRILKLSYDHLPSSSLKCCFAYCSILPKDSEINKDN
ncbi:hypothetical protein RJ640_012238 [Escallonia rubra]|uniref:Uncharacterized protein n=1 Tax=Escallonia rubra TaxID=112253 RepID=A0AA88U4X5_9ASTE|nr:hypothetical protein RJ640_012238 [Escallonia rubra]